MAAYISPNHIEEIVTWVRHRFFAKRFPKHRRMHWASPGCGAIRLMRA